MLKFLGCYSLHEVWEEWPYVRFKGDMHDFLHNLVTPRFLSIFGRQTCADHASKYGALAVFTTVKATPSPLHVACLLQANFAVCYASKSEVRPK